WNKIGTYTRAELGETLRVIRGGGGGQGPVLDAVVFAGDENFTPTASTGTASTGAARTEAKLDTGASNINEGAALALGMIKAPSGTFVEAEANKPGGTNKIVEIEGASGGRAVTSSADYQTVFQAPIPATGDAFRIYVRHKGGPFSLKINNAGKSSDRWFFRKAPEWTWTETDTFSREELGPQLRIGRGAGEDKTIFLDAVVFAPDVKRALPADRPDPAIAPKTIAATIDWNKAAATVSPLVWGINEHQILDPKGATDPKFQQLLGSLNVPLIRIHNAGFMDAWTDAKTRDWDVEKIKAGFAASTGYGNTPVMMNLTWAPKWLGTKLLTSEAQEDELAALWGRLVKIMRDDVKRPVAYWEVINELEGTYEKAGKLDALWRLYNKSAAAIRKADPNARIGGAAFTYAKPSWIAGFLQNCDDVQFLSWHNYGTGDLYQSNEKLFSGVDSNVGALAKGALEAVQKFGKGRRLETFLTETNVKYTWDPYERRHQNQVGSIFQALVVKKMAELGVTGVTLWQQRGDAYGSLINNKNETFPSFHLYGWGPKYLSGKMAAATSGDETLLEIMPVTRANGQKAVLLLNKANHTLILPAAKTLLPGFKTAQQLNAEGVQTDLKIAEGAFSLPGYSLTLLASG
ncbi:MAG: hypothetical protein KY445_09280, partial [Armatimonadetes bacterium]|nr:hypothetical protein [Armatimonadota bacterium]